MTRRARRRPVVAIDGPAAAGKSTAGRNLADALSYVYMDTGSLYRAVGLKAAALGIRLDDGPALEKMLGETSLVPVRTGSGMRILLDREDVTDRIRGEKPGYAASVVSAQPEVRAALLKLQRELGEAGGVVMDGRDIGTVIFPDAEVKFFLDASPEERGRRRYEEMRALGRDVTLGEVIEEIRKRDLQDSSRAHSPLRQAPGAILVDSTRMNAAEVVDFMKRHVERILAGG